MNLSADFEFASRLQNEEYSVMNDSALASLIQEQLNPRQTENRVSTRNSLFTEQPVLPVNLSVNRRATVQPRRSFRGRPYECRPISSLLEMHRMASPHPDNEDQFEDNYEGLVRLGEVLGDVQHRGLRKHEINLLPTFTYTSKRTSKYQTADNQIIQSKNNNQDYPQQNDNAKWMDNYPVQVVSYNNGLRKKISYSKATTSKAIPSNNNTGIDSNDCIIISSNSETSPYEDTNNHTQSSENSSNKTKSSENSSNKTKSSENSSNNTKSSENSSNNTKSSENSSNNTKSSENSSNNTKSSENSSNNTQSSENSRNNAQSSENSRNNAQSSENSSNNTQSSENSNSNTQSSENSNSNIQSSENSNSNIQSSENSTSNKVSQLSPITTYRQNYRKFVVDSQDDDDDDICFVEEWEVVTPFTRSTRSSSTPSPVNRHINIESEDYNFTFSTMKNSNFRSLAEYERHQNRTTTRQDDRSKNNYNKCKNNTTNSRGDKNSEVMKKGVSEGNWEERNSCQVCLCEYEEGEMLRSLPCLHHFHIQCIDTWITNNAVCPICRFEIKHGLTSGL